MWSRMGFLIERNPLPRGSPNAMKGTKSPEHPERSARSGDAEMMTAEGGKMKVVMLTS